MKLKAYVGKLRKINPEEENHLRENFLHFSISGEESFVLLLSWFHEVYFIGRIFGGVINYSEE